MPKEIINDDGVVETFYTPDELAAKEAEIASSFAEKEKTFQAEIEKLRKVDIEKTENIKRLRDMSETEKAGFTAKELEARKIAEQAEDRAKALESRYQEDTDKRAKADKDAFIAKMSGGNAEIKQKMIDSWDLINIPGTDTESISARAGAVFNMVTGGSHAPNPLTAGFNGESPAARAQKEDEAFLTSEKGQAALKAMGMNQ